MQWPEAEQRARQIVTEARLRLNADEERGLVTAIAQGLWEARELGIRVKPPTQGGYDD